MITKYTNCEIIEVKSADEKIEGNSKLASFDHIPQDTYRTNDGYLYVKVRAISSRVNKNFDGWPVNELAGMEEEEFNKLASELIRSDEFFEKDSATASDKEVKKFLKTIKNELGFINARDGKHFRIWHPAGGNVGNKGTIAGTPTNWKAAVEETSKELAMRYPKQWGYYRYLNRYPSVKHLQRAHGQLEGDENQSDDFRTASYEDESKTLTFTKDSSLKTKGDFGFKTFIGRPIFIDHNNSDPQRARGVIVDAMLHVEPPTKTSSDSYWASAPDNHKPETWIELLLEVDGKAFPKLANALIEGKVNAVSMGCNVEYTVCSVCNHEADSMDDYCDHIKKKGTTFKTGNVSKLAYEDCYNINFFEISAVFDPADVTALFTEPVIKNATTKIAQSTDLMDPDPNDKSPFDGLDENPTDPNGSSFGLEESINPEERMDMDKALVIGEEMFDLYHSALAALHIQEDEGVFEEKMDLIIEKLYSLAEKSPEQETLWRRLINDASTIKITGLGYIEFRKENPDPRIPAPSGPLLGEAIEDFENLMHEFFGTPDLNDYADESLRRIQETFNKSPSQEDYDAMLDMGIDPQSIVTDVEPKRPKAFKGINPESKQVETKISSMKIGDSITAPDKVDTLKSEKPCPIGLAGECGLDDESGRCEKCGYREPPKPLDDPDLSKARAFDRQKEEEVEKSNDETKDLIDQLKRTLSKNEKRSVNSKMNDNTKITLTANVEEVPSDSKLAELGWIIPEKEAGAASNTVPVTEDGEAVSDRPKEQRVISDQTKPVESTTKVALGELPGLAQPSGGDSTPQYKGDKNNETSGISEHNPSEMAEQYQSVKRPVEEPQFAGEGYTQDIKQHNPSDTAEQYQKVKKEEEKPQFSGEGGTSGITQHQPGGKQSHESSILSAIKLADLEVELGLNDAEMKYARVAELEDEDPAIVNAKYETLSKIKEAGLTKKEAGSSKKLASFPSMKGTKEASVASSSTGSVPDDAIFN